MTLVSAGPMPSIPKATSIAYCSGSGRGRTDCGRALGVSCRNTDYASGQGEVNTRKEECFADPGVNPCASGQSTWELL